METYEQQCTELEKLIRNGPGRDEESLKKVKALLREILANPWYNTYVSEKAGTVGEYFGMWFSVRRWNRNDGGDQVKSILYTDISKHEGACRTAFKAYKNRGTGQ